jgi:hypothetical protein
MPTAQSKVRKFFRTAPIVLTEVHFFIWMVAVTIIVVVEAVRLLWRVLH